MGYEYKLPKLISCSIFTVRNCAFCFASARCPSMREKCIFLRNKKRFVLVPLRNKNRKFAFSLLYCESNSSNSEAKFVHVKKKKTIREIKTNILPLLTTQESSVCVDCWIPLKQEKKVKCWELPNTKLFESHTQTTARICIPSNENLFDQTYDLVLVHIFLSLPHSLAGHNTFFHRFYVRV